MIFIAALGISYSVLRGSLPHYTGELGVSGIKSSAEVYRDSLGIAYIIAENEEDGAFALGYVHAQERIFQMDLVRRAGLGELSEVLGEKTIPFDELFLKTGIKHTAEKILSSLDKESLAIMEAYSRGVNAFLDNENVRLPVEFDILQYKPRHWRPIHSIIMSKMMAWELNIAWWEDIAFTHIASKIGSELTRRLIPDYPPDAPLIIPSQSESINKKLLGFLDVYKEYRKFTNQNGSLTGSNNWVISGKLSQSGKPIIANDPHLAYSVPGRWFVCVIRAGSWNVEGFSLPGIPAIVIGKNQNVAWALTNVMADEADFYYETIDTVKQQYFLDGQWKPLKIVTDTIKVKSQLPLPVKTYYTHRGPVISGVHPFPKIFPNNTHTTQAISMAWVGNEVSNDFRAFYRINKSTGWEQFREAVGDFCAPGQNFVYADIDGNIGYVCGAKIPLRGQNLPMLINDGTSSANDWKGFVPFTSMPVLFNPAQAYIATANNKTSESFPYYISNLWEPDSRITRIRQLLEKKEKHSIYDFQKYQIDVISPFAQKISGYLTEAFNGIEITDKNLKLAIELIEKWDYSFGLESQTPAIYSYFLVHLIRNTLLDELGPELLNEFCFVPHVPLRSIERLLRENTTEFFDDKRTQKRESREEIIRKSLNDALDEMELLFGTDITFWQWGNIHKARFHHFFSGASAVTDRIFNFAQFPVDGDGTTIFNTEYHFYRYEGEPENFRTAPFENILGPSMRFIYDFSKNDEFLMVMPGGQSGNVFSPHYNDLLNIWKDGKYVTVQTSLSAIRKNTNRLVLGRK